MSAKKRGFLLVLTLLAVLAGSVPSGLAADDGAVEDQAGDANGTAATEVDPPEGTDWPSTAPFSYGPADIRRVWFTTDFVTEPDEAGRVTHRATGITLHVVTEEEFDPSGPTVMHRVDMWFGRSGCVAYLLVDLGGTQIPSGGVDHVRWEISEACEREMGPTEVPMTTVYTDTRWELTKAGKEISLSIPFESLAPWQLTLVGPGATITRFKAHTHVDLGIFPQLDSTGAGDFTVGQDLPQPPSSSSS